MIQNPITFVISNNGTILDAQRGTIRALSNYASKIYLVAPFESVSIKVNYLIYDIKREVISQYLAPTALLGKDVLDPTNPQYQTAGQWQVWEVSISQRALHRIAKYRAGRIGVSFQVNTIGIPSQVANGAYLGVLKTGSTLPNPLNYGGADPNDFYIVDEYNYTDQYVTGTLTKGDYVYFKDDETGQAWLKGQNITQVAMTNTTDLAVDPSLLAELPEDISEDTELGNLIDELIADVAGLQTDVNAHINDLDDPHDIQANQVQSSGPSDVQTDLDTLETRIDDIELGNTDITYDPTLDEIVDAVTVAGAIGQLDFALYDHLQDQDDPHNTQASQVNTTANISVQTALNNLEADKVEKNPDTITSVSNTNKVYVNDGSEKLITIDNFRVSVFDNLVSFGYIIFTNKDANGQPIITNPQTNKIYLFNPSDSDVANDQFEEWIYIDSGFELIGTTKMDLVDYYDKVETDALLDDLQDNIDGKANTVHTHIISDVTNLQSALDGKSDVGHLHDDRYYTETELNNGQLDTRYYTETETNTLLDGRVSITGDDISGILNFTGVDKVHLQQNGVSILSTYKHPTGNTAVPIGQNIFVGLAGNTTMGSTATDTSQSSFNTAFGFNAFVNNTTGGFNSAIGRQALQNNTTGSQNTAQGVNALLSNTTGSFNNGLGVSALFNNTTGSFNNALGVSALFGNTTGSSNQAFGQNAGRFIADGSSANSTGGNSIFVGADTKALANGQTNQVVIGHNATGNGSNTVTLGNDSIVSTHLKGNVVASTATFSGEITAPSIVIGSWRIIPDESSATLNFSVI